MIRALALILGLLIGVAAAVAVGGRMAHLRLIAGDALPGWSQALHPDAGILRGTGVLHGAALRWHLAAIDMEGGRWVMSLNGTDWQVQATVRPRVGAMQVTSVQGLVPAELLAADGQGALAVTDGALRVPLTDRAASEGWLEGRASGLILRPGAAPVDGDARVQGAFGDWDVLAR